MDKDVTFVFHGKWLDVINKLPQDEQDKVIADLVRYGTEMPLQYEDNLVVNTLVQSFADRIDNSKKSYQDIQEMGLNNKKDVMDRDAIIWKLARDGMSAAQIAAELEVSVSTINHSKGWKNRKLTKDEKGAF